MTTARKIRGRLTEKIAAGWYSAWWPSVEVVASALPGRDLLGMPGLAPEVKGRRGFSPVAWIKQAVKNAGGDLPFVLMRPDGYGPERLPDWPVILRNEDFTQLLLEAGYGTRELPGARKDSDRGSMGPRSAAGGSAEKPETDTGPGQGIPMGFRCHISGLPNEPSDRPAVLPVLALLHGDGTLELRWRDGEERAETQPQ